MTINRVEPFGGAAALPVRGSSVHASVRDATPEDAAAISALVHASFRQYIAPDWEAQAGENLIAETTADKLAARLAEAVVALLLEDEGRVLGVIVMPRPTLVQLCFVAPGHTGHGIGRRLWEAARARVEARFPEVRTVELNASPYAVAAYRAFGFHVISAPFVRDGAVATRMACWLPARTLTHAPVAAVRPAGEPPRIAGFVVRPVVLEDAAAWASYACLPVVKEHTSSTDETVDDVRATIDRILAASPRLPTRFMLFDEATNALVGSVGFHTISFLHRTAELSYDVAPSHWGRGIATAACRATTVWAFEVAGWHRVQATTVLSNLRSQRVLQKVGFVREGLVRNFRIVRGRPADYWLFAALPGDVRRLP